jgi:hypothetical protein
MTDLSAEELARRIAIVRALKTSAWMHGFKAPSGRELSEALGDDLGMSQETKRREARRRRRNGRGTHA